MIKVENSNVEVVGNLDDIMTEVGFLTSFLEMKLAPVLGKETVEHMIDCAIKAGREYNKKHA